MFGLEWLEFLTIPTGKLTWNPKIWWFGSMFSLGTKGPFSDSSRSFSRVSKTHRTPKAQTHPNYQGEIDCLGRMIASRFGFVTRKLKTSAYINSMRVPITHLGRDNGFICGCRCWCRGIPMAWSQTSSSCLGLWWFFVLVLGRLVSMFFLIKWRKCRERRNWVWWLYMYL